MPISPKMVFDVCWDVYIAVRADAEGIPLLDPTKVPSDHLWRSHMQPRGEEFSADFTLACRQALRGPENARRLMLCELYYLGLAPYEAARTQMRIREDVWSDWTEEIRDRVGKVLLNKGMFPPKAYFGGLSGPRKAKAKRVEAAVL